MRTTEVTLSIEGSEEEVREAVRRNGHELGRVAQARVAGVPVDVLPAPAAVVPVAVTAAEAPKPRAKKGK